MTSLAELGNVAHDAFVLGCGAISGVVSLADATVDSHNSNLLQPDRLGIEAFGVVAAIIISKFAAKHLGQDLNDLLYGPPSKPSQTNP